MQLSKKGYTTGSCATAAAVAAVYLLAGHSISNVKIVLPKGSEIYIPVHDCGKNDEFSWAEIIKDAGDDPDVTHGHVIGVSARFLNKNDIIIKGGKGVGIATKPGLKVAVGEPAINPVPKQMITDNVKRTLQSLGINKGVELTVYVPEGERLAQKTMNEKLGIIGGISILGTTGIVEPMSEERFKLSLLSQLDIAKALGYGEVVLTPGRTGQESAKKIGFSEDKIVLCGNFIGYMMDNAVKLEFEKITVIGSMGKIVKLAGGIFNTHSRIADARQEILACHAALLGLPLEIVRRIYVANTTEEIISLLSNTKGEKVLWQIALEAKKRSELYLNNKAQVEIIITNLSGEPIAWTAIPR